MFPWGHLAVGYLAFAFLTEFRYRRPQTAGALVALAVGTQLPDLVDKPFAWYLDVLPHGRSLSHSLFAALLLCGLVLAVARWYDRPLVGVAFGCGYLTHLAADGLYPLLGGEWADLAYLFWPVTSVAADDSGYTIVSMLVEGALSPTGLFEAGLLVVAIAVWVRLETPGLQSVRARLERT